MRRFLIFTFVALVLLQVGRFVFLITLASGAFEHALEVGVENCRLIDAPAGPEDLQINHETGIAYISASQRRGRTDGAMDGIYSLDLNNPDARVRKLSSNAPDGFTPHGISLLPSHNRLFAISHPEDGHTVEVFRVLEDRIDHLETKTSDLFTEPNDIVAVGEDAFYLSNFQSGKSDWWRTIERYLGLPTTNIVYHSGGSTKTAASGLISANGINVSSDGTELYVSELFARELTIFERNPASGNLGKRRSVPLAMAPDNIDIEPDGKLTIAGHQDLLAFANHATNESQDSPSHVIRFDPKTHNQETLLLSQNGDFNGSSVGAFWQGNLLIGGVHDPALFWCKI